MRAAIGQMAREAYQGGGGSVSGLRRGPRLAEHDDFAQRYGLLSTALRTQSQILDALKASDGD